MKTRIVFLAALMLASTSIGSQSSSTSPKITDLFSSDEVKRSGLSKLNTQEIAALNAAIFRVMVKLNLGSESHIPASDSSSIAARGLEFYDSSGHATAYVEENDDDLTIYLWSGKPVAYLDDENIYGFNGKHLGWTKGHFIYDHDGNVVAALPDGFQTPVSPAPPKSFKQFVPFKSFKEFAPFKPFFSLRWSETPAKLFFLRGVN